VWIARRAINFVLCREHYPPLLSAAQSKECAPARDYATASALPADSVPPGIRTVACDGYAEGPQLRLALAMLDASSVSIAGEVGARGRADSPTKAGGNYENLQRLAGSE
jgi:hypothetical protein